MTTSRTHIVFSFVAQDKVGIVELLAAAVKNHGGNWHESRLVQLNGLFSGLVSLSIDEASISRLKADLSDLSDSGISITHLQAEPNDNSAIKTQGSIALIGPDRPGIVHEISLAMSAQDINIETMETAVQSAPMSGEALFQARLTFSSNGDINDKLRDGIDKIADQLALDITVDGPY